MSTQHRYHMHSTSCARKSLKTETKVENMLTAAREISNSTAVSLLGVEWLPCTYAFLQTFVDAEYWSRWWGGELMLRKSKHSSRWQNTDHLGDLACSLFLHSLWPLAHQPKAMINPGIFCLVFLYGTSVCLGPFSEHCNWQQRYVFKTFYMYPQVRNGGSSLVKEGLGEHRHLSQCLISSVRSGV